MKKLMAIATASLFLAGTAQAYTLTFDGGACTTPTCADYDYLSQDYGDVPGVVNISYIDVARPGDSLAWWYANYNNLEGVAWAWSSHARIEIKPKEGYAVVLNSMDFGAYRNTTLETNIRVTAIDSDTILFSRDNDEVGNGSTNHNTYFPNVSSSTGLWIDWYDSAYNVGIDNVNFSITSVPEPETYAMLMAGLGLLGFTARRRKQKSLG